VIGPLDPGHDGEAEVLASGPAPTVEHVLLEQREERFHRGVVAGGADSAHGSDEAVAVEFGLEAPRTELAAPVAVNGGVGRVSALDRHPQRRHRELRGHPFVDRVSDDPVRPDVLHGAEIDLALTGRVFGNVGESEAVRAGRGELSLHEVVADGRSDQTSLAAAFADERAEDLVLRTHPPHSTL